ncbi:hypothetical protein AVEN_15306-1 [Araneus ventricosus]|uniref:RING-type domain-containing protein n=1 Tax=Araneus ventricosus TaxID=182803 RepID=A0A4Y2UN24_ARAVE|nr:hypothetical protein AVEN_15306-1 [Araneus ventricosus]
MLSVLIAASEANRVWYRCHPILLGAGERERAKEGSAREEGVSDERVASTVQTEADPDAPRKRLRNENSDVSSAITQDATTRGAHQPPSVLSQAAGNHNHSPDASDGAAAASVLAGTDPDTHSAIEQDASTSGEAQPPSADTSTAFVCPICLGASVRQDQIKRLRCSHVFHQSCIDMWLNNRRSCPLCRAPYRRLPRKRGPNANRRRPRGTRRLR